MLSLDDPIWPTLRGGYRVPYDVSPVLKRLAAGSDNERCWEELWEELHHQGDVGEASYAAVSILAEVFSSRSRDWNLYGLVATIEIERHKRDNPPLPDWLAADYRAALDRIVLLAASDLPSFAGGDDLITALAVIAAIKGDRARARLIQRENDEIEEIFRDYLGEEAD